MKFDRVPDIAKYLSLVFFVYWIGANTVWFFLPIFFEQQISSVFIVGILTSLMSLVPVLIDIPVGNLVQRTGSRAVIFTGFLLGVMPPLLYLTSIPLLLAFGKIFEGLNKSTVWSGSWNISLRSSENENEGETVSVFLLGMNLSAILGPIMGGFLIMSYGFDLLFLIWTFTSMLSLLVFYFYIGMEGKRPFIESFEELFHSRTYSNDFHHLKQNWSSLKLPLGLVLLYSVIFSFSWLAIPLTLDGMDLNLGLMGVVFGLASLPKIFQFLFGELSDRIGNIESAFILSVLMVPLLIGIGLTSSLVVTSLLYFFVMALVMGIVPPVHSLFDENVPDDVEGEMVGFLELFKHTGQAFGPFMAGTLASLYGLSASFYGAAVFALLLVIVTFRHL